MKLIDRFYRTIWIPVLATFSCMIFHPLRAETKVGANHSISKLGLELIWIAPGTFKMGSSNSAFENQRPVTEVEINRGFWLGKTEVTQDQWLAVMGNNPSNFKGPSLPVEQVSWTEAMEFCKKLTERERTAGRLPGDLAYTLPTEAQWEYACRAGTTGDYAGELNSMGWYNQNSGDATHPVAQKKPNPWGLFDMHGNVWEWCSDWYGSYSGHRVIEPKGPSVGDARIHRGGSWSDDSFRSCSAFRRRDTPEGRGTGLGLRLALCSTL